MPPPSATGSIAVRAVQGTPGAPAIGRVPVEVELQHRGMTVNTIKTQTDEHGIVMLEDLPVSMGLEPIVRVQYADLTYQVAGGLMDATHPQQQIDVTCYEPTAEAPPWKVQMRHVMISPTPQGLQVTEVMVIENPTQRTWTGIPASAGSGSSKALTTAFTLPHGAANVTLVRGFHDWCCSTLANDRLINHLPLMPETTEMVYSYLVPVTSGRATIDIDAPSAVDHMMVLVPDALTTDAFSGMQLGGTQSMGESQARYYLASNLRAGDRASITLAGLGGSGLVSGAPAVSAGSSRAFKIVAGVGGGLILLLAAGLIFLKPAKAGRVAISTATAR